VSALSLTTAATITATITGVTISTTSPAQPVVKFQLVNESGQPLSGLTAGEIDFAVAKLIPAGTQLAAVPPQTAAPAPLVSSQWQSYIYTTATPASGGTTADPIVGTTPQPQATVEAGTAGKLVDNGDGTYQYTFAKDISADKAVPYVPALTHRVGFEIRGVTNSAGTTIVANSPVYTLQPSTGATTGITQFDIVDDTSCNGCHQNLAIHGGAREGVKYCVMCHNPSSIDPSSGNTLDFKVLVHAIHTGAGLPNVTGKSFTGVTVSPTSNYYIYGYGGAVSDFSTVVFPQDDASGNNSAVSGPGTRFCTVCHVTSDTNTPQAGNFSSAPSAAACGSCHDNVDFATGAGHSAANIVANDSQCSTCHGPTSTIDNGSLSVVAAHTTGVDTAIKHFLFNIVSVSNTAPGQTPVATVSVTDPTNSNAPYPIGAAGGPFQQSSSALNLDLAWSTNSLGANGVNNVGSGSNPAQPLTINFAAAAKAGTAIQNSDGSFTVTAATALPATATGSLIASLEGRAVQSLANLSGSGTTAVSLGVKTASQTVTITGTTPTTRAAVVDFATKCATCHGTLTVHGENRTLAMVDAKGNAAPQTDINLCASCHNPNATDILDITKSTQTTGACALSSSPIGAADHAIDFKVMIHAIHASGDPYAYNTTSPIYGTYGNGASGATSSTGGLTICSTHAPGGGETLQVLYPPSSDENGVPSLANCEACHLSGTEYPVDPTTVQGTTIHANSTTSDLTQATVATPNAAACSACHTDSSAVNHMLQNGGSFSAKKNANGTLNTASVATLETCSICHGSGGVADVKVVHHVASFPANQPTAATP
jgi:OmcA/MtrC family decaheme c-type cytochrome